MAKNGDNDTWSQGWVGNMGVIAGEQANMSAADVHELWIRVRGFYGI